MTGAHIRWLSALLLTCFETALGQPIDLCSDAARYPKQCAALTAAREALLAAQQWEPIQIPQNIAEVRVNNDLVAITYSYSAGDVIVFHNQYDPGQHTLPLESEKRALVLAVLKAALAKRIAENRMVRNVAVVGHTDLLRPTRQSYDIESYCIKNNIAQNSNHCLGMMRAYLVSRMLPAILAGIDSQPWNINVSYDPDFFMRNTNRQLQGTLFVALGITTVVKNLAVELGIPEPLDAAEARDDPAIQDKINARWEYYKRAFAPFRSVVVILNN